MTEFLDEPDELEKKYYKLCSILQKSQNIVFFTGAGISTAAKIPGLTQVECITFNSYYHIIHILLNSLFNLAVGTTPFHINIQPLSLSTEFYNAVILPSQLISFYIISYNHCRVCCYQFRSDLLPLSQHLEGPLNYSLLFIFYYCVKLSFIISSAIISALASSLLPLWKKCSRQPKLLHFKVRHACWRLHVFCDSLANPIVNESYVNRNTCSLQLASCAMKL